MLLRLKSLEKERENLKKKYDEAQEHLAKSRREKEMLKSEKELLV